MKNVSLRIPKGIFTVVTGVAGSGKSTLVNSVFAKEYKDAIIIDQSAVSANLRSNPATFTGIMDEIRKLFAEENKVSAGLFSYNSEGACESCKGRGYIETIFHLWIQLKPSVRNAVANGLSRGFRV